jgi:uncharacterized membrane-anchored protein
MAMTTGRSAEPGGLRRLGLRFQGDRDRLLAEAHARPSTPLPGPSLATRIAVLSDNAEQDADLNHMVALCRRLGAAEPSPGGRWCAVDAGTWRLRWERHTEISTWTFYRPIPESYVPSLSETALDLAPLDWLGDLPGEVLAAAHLALLRDRPEAPMMPAEDEIACDVAGGMAQVYTDFRPGPDGFTRLLLVQPLPDAALAGRLVQQLFEIETYRLLALLAFPLAGPASSELSRVENEATECAVQVSQNSGLSADRYLLNRLAKLAGEVQALAGRTSFRFSAARAYHGIVQERIQQLREMPMEGRPTIAEFMARRLSPAMRTCQAVSERQERAIEHLSRITQLLSTRVGVAAEETNSSLLASMDRRAMLQLRLQQTVEGLSVAAISYYALGLISYASKALEFWSPKLKPELITGLAVPLVVLGVWLALNRFHTKLKMIETGTRPASSP